jgi:hypothetical protein
LLSLSSRLADGKIAFVRGFRVFQQTRSRRFGTKRSEVQILSPRLTFPNDSPSRPEPHGSAR